MSFIMENDVWGVSWNPGNMGHMLRCAIAIQLYNVEIDLNDKSDSHLEDKKPSVQEIKSFHPHDDNIIPEGMKVVRPYFASKQLSYFPKYLHYCKFFGFFPDGDTMHEYYNITEGENFYKGLLTNIYWHVPDNSESQKCFDIKMDNFFDNFELFVKNFEEFVGQKIKQKTFDFLENKRLNNLSHLDDFKNKVVASVDCIARQEAKDIGSLHDYEKLLIVSTYVQGNWDLTSRFLRNYNNEELKNTMQIHNFLHADG